MDTATIIGYDLRMGACEGGTFIKIDGHPNSNNVNGYYDIDNIPPFTIKNFPVKVKIDWQVNPKCFGNYVDISRMQKNF